jgi:mannose-6-phosphate isomerase-like protein (cupin superfamily)
VNLLAALAQRDTQACVWSAGARAATTPMRAATESPLEPTRGATTMNKRSSRINLFLAATLALAGAATPLAWAKGPGKTVVTPVADLKWSDAGIPGVTTAGADGDMKKGASHFFLKYAAGFVAPMHHHSPDHYGVIVSGNLVLITHDGKEVKLAPGSYFSLKDKAPHAARCEGAQDCIMFIDARGRWDVVPSKK